MKKTLGTKLGDWQNKARVGGICPSCLKEYAGLTVDHVIPVVLLQQIGLIDLAYSDDENLELMCKGCNGMKGGRLDVRNPKTLPLLKKYVLIAEAKYKTT